MERIERKLTRKTQNLYFTLTLSSPLRLRYRATWYGSTLHAEVDLSIQTGRQPVCQKSNELEVSQTPNAFYKEEKAKGVGSSLFVQRARPTSKKEEPNF